MSVDSELENVLKAAENEVPAVARPAPQPEPRKPAKKGNLILLAALLAMAAGVVVLFLAVGITEASIYALPVDEVVAQSGKLEGRRLRVDGELVPGTLMKKDGACEYQFRMQNKGAEIGVRYEKCEIPDTFRDRPEGGVMVTVEGQLAKGGKTIEASMVMAKCASKYDPETHEMEMPDGSRAAASSSAMRPPTN